jgi:hypothetical protein
MPPAELRFPSQVPRFVPDLELGAFVRAHFLTPGGIFHDEEWSHLKRARIGFVWTDAVDRKGGRATAGMAEVVRPPKKQWKDAARLAQLVDWFQGVPDFVITLHVPYSARANDATFYALIDHEICHCDQARGAFGVRLWNSKTGRPKWGTKGHDVEQHVGTVRRWGVDATDTRELIEAGLARPRLLELVGGPVRSIPCGTCRKAA